MAMKAINSIEMVSERNNQYQETNERNISIENGIRHQRRGINEISAYQHGMA
jgi:hypothetical protein